MTQPSLTFGVPVHETPGAQRQRLCDQMAALFRSRPGEPIDVAEQAAIGGISGYRSRIADCRRYFGMDIRPEQPMVCWPDGRRRPRAVYRPEGRQP